MAIYNGKHCVFEQVGVDSDNVIWNLSTNKDSDNCWNNWNISNIRNTHLPARLLLLSNDLQSIITNTTVQTATNGNNGTLVNTSDKLFLPAEKEMSGIQWYSRTEEFNALTTWSYWTNHTSSSDRIKYDSTSTATGYWTRSPVSDNANNALFINTNGSFNGYYGAAANGHVSICYAF